MTDLLRDPNLDQLVADLNEGSAAGEAEALDGEEAAQGAAPVTSKPRLHDVPQGNTLEALLLDVVRRGASDLHLIHGEPPVLRLDGRLLRTEGEAVEGSRLRGLFEPHLARHHRDQLEGHGSADLSIRLPAGRDGAGSPRRFRVNLHRQRGELAASIRALPRDIPTLAALNLPPSLAELVRPQSGLVLVCGPTGAGKTSTLAARVGEINRKKSVHVITIEDPIEYEHRGGASVIEQIEVGSDASSFASALRASLRQDPDVILVGEMRDLETVSTALTAAETGHLILSTLHTPNVAQAIHRMVDVFPPQQQAQIRHQLAMSLNAIVCQQLVPRGDGRGRLPAVELLLANHPVRNHIRKDSLQNLATELTLGKRQGMISMEESLAELVQTGVITAEEAGVRSGRPDELASLLRTG